MKRAIVPLLIAASAGIASASASASAEAGKHAAHRIEMPHFVVEFSLPVKVGKGYASLCEKGYEKLRKIFRVGKDDVVWEGKCRVYLFSNRQEFATFAATVHGSRIGELSGGYTRTEKKDPEIVLFLSNASRDGHIKLQQIMIHEMTHVFLQLCHRNAYLPLWIHEGFAQYFEFQHYAPKSRLKHSVQIARLMVKTGRAAPLAQFMVSRFGPTDLASYAQAWSLIDFMAATPGRRKKTGGFILALKKAMPAQEMKIVDKEDLAKLLQRGPVDMLQVQKDALEEHFGVALAEFEIRWKRYVLERH
jgi:hypothetical protein